MSLTTALGDLRSGTDELRHSIAELAMIVDLDRPSASATDEAAVIGALSEYVTELQASIESVGDTLAGLGESRALPQVLPEIDSALAAASLRYWRQLRAHEPTAELRRTARHRGKEWLRWLQSVETSEFRCEGALLDLQTTMQSSWREVADLLILWLPAEPPTTRREQPRQQLFDQPPSTTGEPDDEH